MKWSMMSLSELTWEREVILNCPGTTRGNSMAGFKSLGGSTSHTVLSGLREIWGDVPQFLAVVAGVSLGARFISINIHWGGGFQSLWREDCGWGGSTGGSGSRRVGLAG